MADEYLDADLPGLQILAVLVDAYWHKPSKDLAAEIRLQRQCFGLTPIDRRRLQWEVDRGDEAESRRNKRKPPEPAKTDEENLEAKDPRQNLRVVK